MTISEAKAKCRALGFSLRKKDGEYRLNLVGGTEATAYYTNDLDDAVGTATMENARRVASNPHLVFWCWIEKALGTKDSVTLGNIEFFRSITGDGIAYSIPSSQWDIPALSAALAPVLAGGAA